MSMERLKLLVATTNRKKLVELQELLDDFNLEIHLLKDFQVTEVEETGKTFEENAALKALGYAAQTGLLTLAEDSGLSCDALDGSPGVYSARFAGEGKSDEDNNAKLLRVLGNMPDNCRSAHYTSVVAVAEPGKLLKQMRGEVHGVILREPRGTGGFGYDPLFYYPPYNQTFAEVTPEMKHAVSHRAKALKQVKDFFEEYFTNRIRTDR
jgi:XTP/dITP diphosphohydrolase